MTTSKPLTIALCCLFAVGAHAQGEKLDEGGPRPYSVLVLDLVPNNADPAEVRIITDLIAAALAEVEGFQVLTSADVQQAIGLEAQKHALGCSDDSCLAELAGALGAELVVSGSAGRLGELHVVSLSFFDSKRARSAGRKSIQVREIEAVPGEVRKAVLELVARIAPEAFTATNASAAGRREATSVSTNDDDAGPPWLLIAGGGGMAAGVVGALAFGTLAVAFDQVLGQASVEADEKEAAFLIGWAGLAGAAVSSLVIAAGAVAVGLSFLE